MPAPSRDIVTKWLTHLGILVAGNLPHAEAKAKMVAYTDFLISNFDAKAFNMRSLEAVARQCKFFPSYSELVTMLAAWWTDNRMTTAGDLVMLPGPAGSVMTKAEAEWVQFYQRRRGEIMDDTKRAPIPDVDVDPDAYHRSPLGRLESLVRVQSPGAWKFIQGEKAPDPAAEAQPPPEVARVTRALSGPAQVFARSTIPEPAPQAERVRPQYLDRDALARVRAARGIPAAQGGQQS